MSDQFFSKVASLGTFLNSFVIFSSGIIFIAFVPQTENYKEFLRLLSYNMWGIQLFKTFGAVIGFLGIFTIVALYDFFKKESKTWSLVVLIFGIFWAFSQITHGLWDTLRFPLLSAGGLSSSESVRSAAIIELNNPSPVDPNGIGTFVFLSFWIFVLALLAISTKRLSQTIAYVSLFTAFFLIILFAGQTLLPKIIWQGLFLFYLLFIGPLFWLLLGIALSLKRD